MHHANRLWEGLRIPACPPPPAADPVRPIEGRAAPTEAEQPLATSYSSYIDPDRSGRHLGLPGSRVRHIITPAREFTATGSDMSAQRAKPRQRAGACEILDVPSEFRELVLP